MYKGQSNDYEREMLEAESLNSPGAYTGNKGGFGGNSSGGGAYVPQAAVPTQNGKLSQYAGEFWFPECRNCTCCKGYKHGCDCCKNSGGAVDTCTNANCVDGAFATQVSEELARRPAAAVAPASASAAPAAASGPITHTQSAPRAPAAASAGAGGGGGGDLCKFESAPGGCRFGASCRFKHSFSPAPSYNGGAPAGAGAGGPPKCVFFAQGKCQYGDGCRFSHQ
jgi:hypothetical protein